MHPVRYFGRCQPISAAKYVEYQDPAHPSYVGSREARVRVWSRCEDEGVPRDQWPAALRQSLRVQPYPGMDHIGGVCRIEQSAEAPFEEEITEVEYEELAQSIRQSNDAYLARSAEQLVQANDPTRRANPDDEALGWRTRVWVLSHTKLDHHVPYRVDESCRVYCRVRNDLPNGATLQLLDVYHASTGNHFQVAMAGLEHAERCVDLLALAGFAPATLATVVGTSPSTCHRGVPFKVVVLQAHVSQSSVGVEPQLFAQTRLTDEMREPLRHVRQGFGASLPTAAVASFWNALEKIAEAEARKSQARRTVKCENCGHERQAGWNTKDAFNGLYDDAGVGREFDRHRALRGRVQHGETFVATRPPAEFLADVGHLLKTAVVAVSRRIGLLPQADSCLLTGIPALTFECVVDGEEVSSRFNALDLVVAPAALSMRANGNKGRSVFAGAKMGTTLDPLVLPPLIS